MLDSPPMSDFPCPYDECDGSGWIPVPPNDARRCRCMEQRVAVRRARGLSHAIPKRYRDVGFERFPVTRIDPEIVHEVREYCASIEERLGAGEGLWFAGPKGTGKTTLAMIVSQHALRARRTVAIYTAPVLLAHISDTYDEGSEQSYLGFLNRLASVDLLHIDDLAVARQNEWVLEQLYTVINRRYEDQRSIIFTADVSDLADHVGARTYSRLLQMCGDPLILEGEDARVTFPAPS
jgi:DNA replication protein DnaC